MKRETFFLKIAVFTIGLPILALSIIGVPWLANNPVNPEYAYILYPVVIVIYLSLIPFYLVLHKVLRLLGYVDRNITFSELALSTLKSIRCYSITISILYVIMMPFVYIIADKDDAPGLIIIGIIPIFASMVIAVFANLLQKLLKDIITKWEDT